MSSGTKFGNPNIFSLSAFSFSLLCLGSLLLFTPQAAGAALYAVLYAAILEIIGGMWNIANGDGYVGGIVTTFGGWLLGYYFLMTQGRALHLFTNASVATYMFALLPPLIVIAIPAFLMKKPLLIYIFLMLGLLVTCLGIQAVTQANFYNLLSGVFSFLAAIGILLLATENVLEVFHEQKLAQAK